VETVSELDDAVERRAFMELVFDAFGVRCEELSFHCSLLEPTSSLLTDAFPGIPEGGLAVAWDRERAIARDDAAFLSWEHPIVTGAIDLLTGGEHGNCACAHWPAEQGRILLLETLWIVEPVAPGSLHADQFLPAVPLRVVVDHGGNDRTDAVPTEKLQGKLRQPRDLQFFQKPEIQQELLPGMLAGARTRAEAAAGAIRQDAAAAMQQILATEVQRLRELAADHSGPADTDAQALEERKQILDQAIQGAPLRLDAIRLIWRAPED
jgi:ATP-dependent helicase HepA